MQQRDSFLTALRTEAIMDPSVMLINMDFGAPALDAYRYDCPNQFIHAGISEQNAVDVAVGLALSGKRPYLYAMAPFFLRCYEQLKLAAIHQVPITVVAVGAGFSYAGSGPTHYSLEDIACYRALCGVEVYTCSTPNQAAYLAQQKPTKMRIIRLERGEFPELYPEIASMDSGFIGAGNYLACGYLVHYLRAKGHQVMDVYRQKPISPQLVSYLSDFDNVYTFEEQYRDGGFGAAIIEALSEYGKKTRVFRRHIQERPIYENGNRDQLLEACL